MNHKDIKIAYCYWLVSYEPMQFCFTNSKYFSINIHIVNDLKS